MQIILLQDVENLGNAHEVVTVKDGYGRNYLIPKGSALVANKTNLANLKEVLRQHDARENKMLGTYQALAAKASAVTLKLTAKAGESGKLFGSISAAQIVEALKTQAGVEVDRKKVIMPDEVKELGAYTATLNLHKQVQAPVNFEVVAEKAATDNDNVPTEAAVETVAAEAATEESAD
jgi:large subunit ribosomal protein L9